MRRAGGRVVIAMALACAGCATPVFVPETHVYHDAKCDVTYRKMTLTTAEMSLLQVPGGAHCGGSWEGCAVLLAAELGKTPISAVVSGSIVVIGNTIYWAEKTGRCLLKDAPAAPAPST